MKFRWMVLLLAILVSLPALAHGNKKHVIGTIEKLGTESMVVKTQDGKSVEIKLAATTTYVTSANKPAKLADLAEGQRVVVHADPKGADLIAATVKFSTAKAVSSAAPSAQPK
jgi:hypothetical protein